MLRHIPHISLWTGGGGGAQGLSDACWCTHRALEKLVGSQGSFILEEAHHWVESFLRLALSQPQPELGVTL